MISIEFEVTDLIHSVLLHLLFDEIQAGLLVLVDLVTLYVVFLG